MKKNIVPKIVAGVGGIALLTGMLLGGSAAIGATTQSTPYLVAADGVHLPEGVTFPAHGHVNWHTTLKQGGTHFDPNNNQPGGAFIGKNFFPITLSPGECITWVQVAGYNEHFNSEDGTDQPVCAPTGTETPTWESTPTTTNPSPTSPVPGPTPPSSPTPTPISTDTPVTPGTGPSAEPPLPTQTPTPTPPASTPVSTPSNSPTTTLPTLPTLSGPATTAKPTAQTYTTATPGTVYRATEANDTLPQTGTNIDTWYAQVAILLVLAGIALVLIGGSKDKND